MSKHHENTMSDNNIAVIETIFLGIFNLSIKILTSNY